MPCTYVACCNWRNYKIILTNSFGYIKNKVFRILVKGVFNMRNITNELVFAFKTNLINQEKSKATLEKYLRDITAFMLWLNTRAVEKSVVLEYKNVLVERYAPSSVNSILSSLNSFFSFNEWFDCLVKTIKVQKQIFSPANRELTKTEYERLLKAAHQKRNTKLFYLMQTICATGIRVSELKFITVGAVSKGEALINCKGKIRIVLLPKQLCKMLKQYVRENNITKGSVFVSKNGYPLDRSNIWKLMKKLCEYAGVSKDKVFPHNLRHLFARTYYSLEKDIVRLADILGHSSVNTTRIYTAENGDVHRRQIQKLGLLKC